MKKDIIFDILKMEAEEISISSKDYELCMKIKNDKKYNESLTEQELNELRGRVSRFVCNFNVPLSAITRYMNITSNYLSMILSGTRKPSADVANALHMYLERMNHIEI